MSKKLLISISIILITGLIVLNGVYAKNLFKGKERDFPPLLRRLNLTEEQKLKIENILKNLKDKSEDLIKVINENCEKEKELISKEIIDEKELDYLVESQIKNLIDLTYLRKDAYLDIISILNNNQRKIFPTFLEFSFIIKPNTLRPDFNGNYIDKLKLKYLLELKFLKKRLNLNNEQFEKLKEIFKNEKEKEKFYLERIKENNRQQRETLKSENFDKEKLSNLINEYIIFEREIYSLRKNLYFEYLKILTFEQRKNSPTSIFFLKGM